MEKLIFHSDAFSPPGVNAIFIVHPDSLPPDVREAAFVGAPIHVLDLPERVSFFGEALYSHSVDKENDHSISLSFSSRDLIPEIPLCFLVVLNDGARVLIGAREAPFPSVTFDRNAGHAGNSTNSFAYKISFSGRPARAVVLLPEDHGLPLV